MSVYRSQTYAPRTPTTLRDPIIVREGYTQPFLTIQEHASVILGVGTLSAVLARPIANLSHFSFMTASPGDRTQAIFPSDKRAHFFRTLFSINWFAMRGVCGAFVHYTSLLALFILGRECFRELFDTHSSVCGLLGGAVAGAAYTLVRQPIDVLRATAAHPATAAKKFSGPLDVFWSLMKEKPASALRGLWRGGRTTLVMNALQYGVFFGFYDLTKNDLVARGQFWLALWNFVGACTASVIAYPFLNIRQIVHVANVNARPGMELSAKAVINQMRKKHGISKVFDGFFRSRPFLNSIPLAILVTGYDIGSRRYTEYLHPERKAKHSTLDQDLFFQFRLPGYVQQQQYEQEREKERRLNRAASPPTSQ